MVSKLVVQMDAMTVVMSAVKRVSLKAVVLAVQTAGYLVSMMVASMAE
jgi:hypothetical protein